MRDYLLGSDLIGGSSNIVTFVTGSTITADPVPGTTLSQNKYADLGIKPMQVTATSQPDEVEEGTTLTQDWSAFGQVPARPKPQPPGMGFPGWELGLIIGGAALAASLIVAFVARAPSAHKA